MRGIELLLDLRKRCRLVALRGNHEIMMLHARGDRFSLLNWIACGGGATLDSRGASGFQGCHRVSLGFSAGTVRHDETDHDFIGDANMNSDLPLEDQPDDTLSWEHLDGERSPHVSGQRMICGHTSHASGLSLDPGDTVCLDTHACGEDGGPSWKPASLTRRSWTSGRAQ